MLQPKKISSKTVNEARDSVAPLIGLKKKGPEFEYRMTPVSELELSRQQSTEMSQEKVSATNTCVSSAGHSQMLSENQYAVKGP